MIRGRTASGEVVYQVYTRQDFEDDVLYETVGLEGYLGRDAARQLSTNQRRHKNLIIQAQDQFSQDNFSN